MSASSICGPRAETHKASQFCKCMESALKSGQWQAAVRLGEKVLSCLPHHLWAECLLGQAYLALGEMSQAHACFHSIAKRDPDCIVGQIGLTVQLEHSAAAGQKGRGDFPHSRSPDPSPRRQEGQSEQGQFWAGLCDRAESLWRVGNLEEAAREAGHVLQMAPQSLKAILLLTDIAFHRGDLEQFAEWFRQAQTLDPSGVLACRTWGTEHPLLHVLTLDPLLSVEAAGQAEGGRGTVHWELDASCAEHGLQTQQDSVDPPSDPPWLLDSSIHPGSASRGASSLRHQVPGRPGDDSSQGIDAQLQMDEDLADVERELRRIASSLGCDEVSALLSSSLSQPVPLPSPSRPAAPSLGPRSVPIRRSRTTRAGATRELIVSSRGALEEKYGQAGASRIHRALTELAEVTTAEGRVQALLFYLDDPEVLGSYGLKAIDPRDPQELKFTLNRLEECLRDDSEREGEQPGTYLLLVGGDDIVPFHPLPDPSEDEDEPVLSDHPYASVDASYLSFERAVGRLPDGASRDPGFLLRLIAVATAAHRQPSAHSSSRPSSVWQALRERLGRAPRDGRMTSFGYTASIWRRAAREVFSSIGEASLLRTSPPLTCEQMPPLGPIAPRLSYFNLHGLRDSAYWYGQRDPTYAAGYPLFPVAIEPGNIPVVPQPEAVVFSEACYGAHVLNRHEMSSIALRFLAAQAVGVVGSTAVAYGAIDIPLVGADLLAKAFWEQAKVGRPVGEALRQAKQALIQEMMARQGYLDPEDQKTLLSFVLYGDPTLVAATDGVPSVTLREMGQGELFTMRGVTDPGSSPALHLGCASVDDGGASTLCRRRVMKAGLVSPEIAIRVHHHLASYLPSSEWRDVAVSAQTLCRESRCQEGCSLCRAAASDESSALPVRTQVIGGGSERLPSQAELVFTLERKPSAPDDGVQKVAAHHQIVKVTVDCQGHLVKIAISR